eukprot:7758191-Pyramimonas_sp.AAC.1
MEREQTARGRPAPAAGAQRANEQFNIGRLAGAPSAADMPGCHQQGPSTNWGREWFSVPGAGTSGQGQGERTLYTIDYKLDNG